MSLLTVPSVPQLLLTDTSDSGNDSGDENEFHVDQEVSSSHTEEHIETTKKIFFLLLDEWMYGYGDMYTAYHFMSLFERLLKLVSENKIIQVLLPGFPVKSPNNVRKVLSFHPDFAEHIALKAFLVTIRKVESLYKKGMCVTIMSDYHTFDQHLGVSEENYSIYHEELKNMIKNIGGCDVIKLISLSSFPEFQDTLTSQLSTRLSEEYGCHEFLQEFDTNVKEDTDLLEKYRQMLKFMQTDQETRLPGSPRSRRTRSFLKEVATGMMSQGIALDAFLKEQEHLQDYVRISIHNHHPKKGKFAVDLFKHHTVQGNILRTPWHHTVMFDSVSQQFLVDHKSSLMENPREDSIICTVMRDDKMWFLIRLRLSQNQGAIFNENQIRVSIITDGCGLMLENKSRRTDLKSDILHSDSITGMIKHFGVVILRGFGQFMAEEDLYITYSKRSNNGIIPWKASPVHVVKPSPDTPGYVNKKEGVPIHWDLMLPPSYMGISQAHHTYEDFTCREFLLYCHRNSQAGTSGATTFIDASAVLLSLHGQKTEKWKSTTIVCESRLLENNDQIDNTKEKNEEKSLYFGGQGNTKEYPLIYKCPWTGKYVLRWLEIWTAANHPGTVQMQAYEIKPSQDAAYQGVDCEALESLEREIRDAVFDDRFYFGHTYEEGDQVYVNNYTMLHGRHSFTNERELWRVQLIPPSDNIPKYFQVNGHSFYNTHEQAKPSNGQI